MSRIGKKIISIPSGVDFKIEGNKLTAKGPAGEVVRNFDNMKFDVVIKDKTISAVPKGTTENIAALWGTCVAHIGNMIAGAEKGFEKKMIIEGVGYKAQVGGTELTLSLGLSHPVKLQIPAGLKVVVEKSIITITGADPEKVGQFSANVRALKKPEPYKGKGIAYSTEVIRRKSGKKTAAAAA